MLYASRLVHDEFSTVVLRTSCHDARGQLEGEGGAT